MEHRDTSANSPYLVSTHAFEPGTRQPPDSFILCSLVSVGADSVQVPLSLSEAGQQTSNAGLAETAKHDHPGNHRAFLLGLETVCQGQIPSPTDGRAAEMAELTGAPVLAWDNDGAEVGKVSDVLSDNEGQPLRLRMKAAASLGLGERTIEVRLPNLGPAPVGNQSKATHLSPQDSASVRLPARVRPSPCGCQ